MVILAADAAGDPTRSRSDDGRLDWRPGFKGGSRGSKEKRYRQLKEMRGCRCRVEAGHQPPLPPKRGSTVHDRK